MKTITFGNKVMVSDPCYGLNTWCQGVLENVLPGDYRCNIEYSDEKDWGMRVSAIEVVHQDYERPDAFQPETFEVGVDSGQAGIFDYDYYTKYHTDGTDMDNLDDDWYDRVCTLTLEKLKNPDYEAFNWDIPDELPEDTLKRYKKYEYSDKYWPYIEKLTGNTIDDLGLVSSSGYGDGGYTCWTSKNKDGNIIAIRVEFITEYDDENDYEEEY